MSRSLRRVLFATLIFLSLLAGAIVYAAPHVGVFLCPGCYGFSKGASRVCFDDGANETQAAIALENLAAANRQVLEFYPDRSTRPVWLFCLSEQCLDRFGRGPLALTYFGRFVFVYPDGATATILTHETAHTELQNRAGITRSIEGVVPAWFDEGLAVYISRDPRYLRLRDGKVTGCRERNLPEPPTDGRRFLHLAATQAYTVYTASACKVIDWLDDHGGPQGVIDMAVAIRAGQPFAE